MANELSSLSIREVSLVDNCANASVDPKTGRRVPHARVALFKRDDGGSMTEKILKQLYPPLGSTAEPKAQSFKEVLDGLQQMEEFKQLGEDLQNKLNALGQVIWSAISDKSITDKQAAINTAVDDFVASVKKCELAFADDSGVSKKGKTQGGVTYPKSDYAYTPDDTPSHWKLRLTSTPGGKPDAGIVGAAIAALGKGFRGNKVQIPAEALPGVKARVRAAWRAANPDKSTDDMPEIIRKGESNMTLEELEAKVVKQDETVAALKAESDLSKAETALVLKMSKKERKLYASMDEAKRKTFMAADADKRKAMMEEADKARKEKKLCNTLDADTKKRFDEAGPLERAEILKAAALEQEKLAKGKKKSGSKPDVGGDDDDDEDEDEEKRKLAKVADSTVKLEAELAALRKRDRLVTFIKVAETELSHTPGSPEEKGTRLMKMADTFGDQSEDYKKVFESLKDADKAIARGFQEIGKDGSGSMITAEKEIDVKVAEIVKRDKVSKDVAMIKASEEYPDLFMEYEQQHRQRAARYNPSPNARGAA